MCQGLARCFLIFANVIFLLFGIACLVAGIWVRVDKNNLISLLRISDNGEVNSYDVPSLLESGAYILIAVGAIIFVISIFGFCGAIRKNKCCLMTYGVLVGLVLVVQVAAAVAAGVFQGQFDNYAKKFLNETMPKKYIGPYNTSDVVSLALDAMQATQKCCGINGQNDFTDYKLWNKTWTNPDTGIEGEAKIPFTCCKTSDMEAYPEKLADYYKGMVDKACPVTKAESYTDGCYDKLRDLVKLYFATVLGVAIGVAIMELILIVIACCIAKKNEDEIV